MRSKILLSHWAITLTLLLCLIGSHAQNLAIGELDDLAYLRLTSYLVYAPENESLTTVGELIQNDLRFSEKTREYWNLALAQRHSYPIISLSVYFLDKLPIHFANQSLIITLLILHSFALLAFLYASNLTGVFSAFSIALLLSLLPMAGSWPLWHWGDIFPFFEPALSWHAAAARGISLLFLAAALFPLPTFYNLLSFRRVSLILLSLGTHLPSTPFFLFILLSSFLLSEWWCSKGISLSRLLMLFLFGLISVSLVKLTLRGFSLEGLTPYHLGSEFQAPPLLKFLGWSLPSLALIGFSSRLNSEASKISRQLLPTFSLLSGVTLGACGIYSVGGPGIFNIIGESSRRLVAAPNLLFSLLLGCIVYQKLRTATCRLWILMPLVTLSVFIMTWKGLRTYNWTKSEVLNPIYHKSMISDILRKADPLEDPNLFHHSICNEIRAELSRR